MWTQLQAYHDQHSEGCIIALQAKYYNFKLNEGESIAIFISTLQQLAKQLTDLGQTITERQLISKIICGLPSSFDPLLLAWDNIPVANQSLLGLQSRLIKLQSKLRDRAQQIDTPVDRVFFTKGGPSGVSPSGSSPTVEQKKERADRIARHKRHARCYQCGQRGHFGKDCPNDSSTSDDVSSKRLPPPRHSRRQPHQRPPKGKKSQAHITASSIHSDTATDCSFVSSEAYYVTTSSENSSSPAEDTFWFADSGATEHMTDKLQWFTNFQSIDNECWTVTVADNNVLYVRGIGDIPVHATINGVVTSFRLKNVLYVPQLRRNLISIGRLTENRVAIVHLRDQCKIITDDGHGPLLMLGSKFHGLWRLHIAAIKSQSSANLVDTASPVTVQPVAARVFQKWHSRLGHVNFRTLHQMSTQARVDGLPALSKLESPLCVGCVHGKHHRGAFPVHAERKRVSKPGLFFHCDISGPFQVLSHGGHSYFITFKDDHSSLRFVFFMTNRSKALSKLKILYKLAKKETGHSMSKLRTDNGREFLSKDFQDFIQLKGIRYELTAPYTPEQNFVVERDNRTVVESARSMLYHYSMPLSFWGEAINTAVYVLNRVSSRTLHGDTPYTKWYGIKPDVSYFRVFGSLCYAHIPKPLRQKLDSKARECIFVGYCSTSKAYRLWCPRKKKIIVARNVIFDEDTSSHFSSPPQNSSSSSSSFLPNYDLLFFPTTSASQSSFPVNTQSSGSSIGVLSPGVSSQGVPTSSPRVSSSSSPVGGCRAPLHKGCPKHQGHKGDPGVTPGTCGAGGEKAQMILVWVRAPGVGNASHPRRLGVMRVRP
jgi:transposase InsO family protein